MPLVLLSPGRLWNRDESEDLPDMRFRTFGNASAQDAAKPGLMSN